MATRSTNLSIGQALRRRIIHGDWRPGRRLPTRLELEKQLGASTATIQKAVDQLVADGFLETRGRAGTFVRAKLPHLYRMALALPPRPASGEPTSRFWRALREAAEQVDPTTGIEVRTYYDVEIDPPSDSYRQLVEDIERERIGGLMGVSIDWSHARGTPLLEHPRLCRVAMTGGPVPGVSRIWLEPYEDRVTGLLAEEGMQRLAVIHHASQPRAGGDDPTGRRWRAAAERHGRTMRQGWLVPVHPASPQTAEVAVLLLADLPAERRPDALMIADDHLVEATTAGVHAAGLRVPDDLVVFAHCNFPDHPPSSVPVRWVGYDAAMILQAGLDLLRRQLRGEPIDREPIVPCILENEHP